MTTVIYHADEFGHLKREQYVQIRLPDGQISLDYSEHYDSHPERVTHRDVVDSVPPVSTPPPQIVVTSSVEGETDDEQSEDSDSQTEAEEKVLTEEEKKGLQLVALLCIGLQRLIDY